MPARSIAARRCSPTPARAATPSKAPPPAGGSGSVAAARARLSQCWNDYWAWTKTDDFKTADARDRQRARLPGRQLPLHRSARAGDAAADQRLQPAGDQRARAATSGTTSRRRPTRTLPSVGTITLHDPFTGEPAVQDAGRRARLYAAAVADQPLVDGAVPAQQHVGGRSSSDPSVDARMRVVPGIDRADAVAGEAQARSAARRPTGDPVTIDRTTERSYISCPTAIVPERCVPCRAG